MLRKPARQGGAAQIRPGPRLRNCGECASTAMYCSVLCSTVRNAMQNARACAHVCTAQWRTCAGLCCIYTMQACTCDCARTVRACAVLYLCIQTKLMPYCQMLPVLRTTACGIQLRPANCTSARRTRNAYCERWYWHFAVLYCPACALCAVWCVCFHPLRKSSRGFASCPLRRASAARSQAVPKKDLPSWRDP